MCAARYLLASANAGKFNAKDHVESIPSNQYYFYLDKEDHRPAGELALIAYSRAAPTKWAVVTFLQWSRSKY